MKKVGEYLRKNYKAEVYMITNRKIYVFSIVEGISMILFGVFMVTDAYIKITKETEMLVVLLLLILTTIATVLGISRYNLLKKQNPITRNTSNLKKSLRPKHIMWFLLFNLIMLFRLILFILI